MSVEDENHVAKFKDPFHLIVVRIISLALNFSETLFNKALKASNIIRKDLLKIIKQMRMDLAQGVASPT